MGPFRNTPGKTGAALFFWVFLLYSLCSANARAQARPEFGLHFDVPVRGPIAASTDLSSCRSGFLNCLFESTPWHVSIGISASVPIARRLRLRADPRYQRVGISESAYGLGFERGPDSPLGEFATKYGTTGNRWLFPILAEGELTTHARLGLGPELSLITGSRTVFEVRDPFGPDRSGTAGYFRPVSPLIFGIGAALEFPFRFSRIVIAPEVHYHHWTGKHYGGMWLPDEISLGIAVRI